MGFDLNERIKSWLKEHRKTGAYEDGQIMEIEDHLRSKVEAYLAKGLSEETAFEKGVENWGHISSHAKKTRAANSRWKSFYPLMKQLVFILRTFRKSPTSTLLNIGGLTMGIAGSMVIMLFVLKEHSYDELHARKDRIFRVELDNKTSSGTTHFVTTGPPTGQFMKNNYEEVENAVTIKRGDEVMARFEDKAFYEDKVYYVEQTFFEIFDFQLKFGDRQTALTRPNSVVLSLLTSQKYFGEINPVGKTLELGGRSFAVTAVMEELPNTHFDMEVLASFSSYEYPAFGSPTSWSWITFYNYVLLKEGSNKSAFERKLPELVKTHFSPTRAANISLSLKEIKNIYLTPSSDADEIGPTSDRFYSEVLTLIAFLLMLVAGLNYVNLSTALVSRRLKEVGIRKALGAHQASLFRQFLLESVLIGLISSAIGLLLSYLFVGQMGHHLGLSLHDLKGFLRHLLGTAFLLGMVISLTAGIYPAILFSNFKVRRVTYNGKTAATGKLPLRKILVSIQYIISISLIVVTLIILKQINFLTSKDLGFSKHNVVIVPLKEPSQRDRYLTFETLLEQRQGISEVAAARLGLEGLHGSYQFVESGSSAEEAPRMSIYPVNLDFIDLLGIEHLAGRKFKHVSRVDTLHKFMMNEAAVSLMNWDLDDVDGKKGMLTGQGGIHGELIGVVRNFHFEPLQNEIEPLVLWFRENASNYVYIKSKSQDMPGIIEEISEVYTEVFPEFIFEYEFLDRRINENYLAYKRMAKALTAFSILAILISCVGLFGLMLFVIQRRMKEVAVRKVLGANARQILVTLSMEFFVLIGLTSIAAVPTGYLGGLKWLDSFAYRTSPGIEVFLLAVGIVSAITALTISYHTLRAAFINPSKIIRYE